MFKFQCKIIILNFLTCANLHMIEKPLTKYLVFYLFIEPGHGYKPRQLMNPVKIDPYQKNGQNPSK